MSAGAETFHGIEVQRPVKRPAHERLNFIVVGAGLGGVGTAIALLLAGHNVQILESASQIAEIGAGIQVLPNSSRVLIQWGLGPRLVRLATIPKHVEMLGWKGNLLTSHDFGDAAKEYGAPFWDFHRADLHGIMLDRVTELGGTWRTKARVIDVDTTSNTNQATVVLSSGERLTADLIIGADGIFSTCRNILLGHHDEPVATGDLAYRVLLSTEGMSSDPDLAEFLETHNVRYWMGPAAHAVTYVLRQGKLLNCVLLVPDDMPANATTIDGNVAEMQALYEKWDPRIGKLLRYCKDVQKWKLCYRPGLERAWYNETGTFVLLGDAVHATLPYLASGAGMSLEDAAVLGHCFSRVHSTSTEAKVRALAVYEKCRRSRTESIVDRGNLQQYLYHIDDGAEQEARDERFRAFERVEREVKASGTAEGVRLPDGLKEGDDPLAWRRFGVGRWLIGYDCAAHVEAEWPKEVEGEAGEVQMDARREQGGEIMARASL